MRTFRALLVVFLSPCVAPIPATAHHLEAISTDFARPFAPGAGSLQFNYEYERRPGTGLHLIPKAEFELGFAPRMQFSIEIPVIYEQTAGAPSRLGVGHTEFSFRYLLAGGEGRKFALSVNPFVAPPTGRQSLAGDATEAGIALHFDREFSKQVLWRGNDGWSTTIGGGRSASVNSSTEPRWCSPSTTAGSRWWSSSVKATRPAVTPSSRSSRR